MMTLKVLYTLCLLSCSVLPSLVDVHNPSPTFPSLPSTVHGPRSSQSDLWKMYIRVDFPAAESLPVTSHQYWNDVLRSCCSSQALWRLSACSLSLDPAPPPPALCPLDTWTSNLGSSFPTQNLCRDSFLWPGCPFPSLYNHLLFSQENRQDLPPSPFYRKVRFPSLKNLLSCISPRR